MILKFNNVTLHNFGSYATATVSLTDRGFCAVSGRNKYKKDNALSNGSGKSMLWSAICFALTGETITGLKSNLKNLNINEDECWVSLDFTADEDRYTITRIHKPKSDLKIIKNDIDESGKGIRESEQKLAELLPDLTKDLIASTILIGQGMPNKFSSFSPSGRKELLEKLTKSDFMIEDIKQRLTSRQFDIQQQIGVIANSILLNNQQLNKEQTELQEKQTELHNMVSPDYAYEIKNSEMLLANIAKDITNSTANIIALEKEVELLNEELIKLGNDKAAQYSKLTEAYTTATSTLNQEKTDLELKVRTLDTEIIKLKSVKDVCPTCGQKIHGIEKPDTTEKEAELKTLREALSAKQTELTEKKTNHDHYAIQIEADYSSKTISVRQKLNDTKINLNKEKDNLNNFSTQEQTEKDHLVKLKYDKENHDTYYKNLKTAVTKLTESVANLQAVITVSIAGKTELEEHLEVTKKMDTLIKRDFRGYLLSDIINYINIKAKEYCEIVFETRDLEIYLDGNNIDITYCGKNIDALSGGEKQRCDLILQFAIRDLLQTYLGYSSNILVLDEIFDNLDKVATDKVLVLIVEKLKDIESIFIISHHTDELEIPIDSEISIIKNEDGISEIY